MKPRIYILFILLFFFGCNPNKKKHHEEKVIPFPMSESDSTIKKGYLHVTIANDENRDNSILYFMLYKEGHSQLVTPLTACKGIKVRYRVGQDTFVNRLKVQNYYFWKKIGNRIKRNDFEVLNIDAGICDSITIHTRIKDIR